MAKKADRNDRGKKVRNCVILAEMLLLVITPPASIEGAFVLPSTGDQSTFDPSGGVRFRKQCSTLFAVLQPEAQKAARLQKCRTRKTRLLLASQPRCCAHRRIHRCIRSGFTFTGAELSIYNRRIHITSLATRVDYLVAGATRRCEKGSERCV